MSLSAEILRSDQPRDRIAGMKKPKHLFILRADVLYSADDQEVRSTLNDLREMNLYHLPYDQDVYIQVNSSDLDPLNAAAEHSAVLCGPMDAEKPEVFSVNLKNGSSVSFKGHPAGKSVHLIALILRDLLVVFLATKNAERVTTENKLAKMGIGKSLKNKFRYTTTISIPQELPDDPDNPANGARKAPHLRRGHIRRQHYGEGNLMEKKVWIAPIFVNADPAFVRERQAYLVTGR